MSGSDDTVESHFRGCVTQKAIIFNRHEDILLVRPTVGTGWTLPGGRIQEGEGAEEALTREITEETGLSIRVGKPVKTMTELWFTDGGEPMFTVVYECATEESNVTLNDEHEAFEWVPTETAIDRMPIEPLAVAVKRAITVRQ